MEGTGNSPHQPREAVLVINALSRFGLVGIDRAKASLERCGIRVKQAEETHSPKHVAEFVEDAVKKGESLIVVGGGDGTIAAVVDYFAYKDSALGILPLGTGNDFARTLGIPDDIDGACKVIAEGKITGVNLGKVNGDYFVNAASVGFSALSSRRTPGWLKRTIGFGAYVLGAIASFWLYEPFKVTLIMDGVRRELETSLIIVWNGRFHAGWELPSAGSAPDERKLLVYAPAAPSRLNLLRLAFSLRLGRLVNAPPVLASEVESVVIEAMPPQEVDVDGEVLHRTPVTVLLAPCALKVVVPNTFAE